MVGKRQKMFADTYSSTEILALHFMTESIDSLVKNRELLICELSDTAVLP